MTLGTMSDTASSAGGCFCSCCGAKMMPYFSDDAVVSQNQINHLIGESFLTVKGAALFLPRGNSPTSNSAPHVSQRRNKHTGDLQQHLHTMFTVLRPEDNIRLAVRLESAYPLCTRYMVVVSTAGRQDTEESIVLGVDFPSSDSCCTVGLVLPLWSDTLIHLDGDGGFSVSTVNRVHVFKPVSVQAMWSALQSLHKACEVARGHNYYPGSSFLTWVSYYQSRVSSDQHCINEWNAMQDVQSHRADSPVLFADVPTERERTERLIKTRLREIMMQKDLENVTSKEIRIELEMQMVCNLREFKEFIDKEMIVILGQMDSPTEIFDHVFLGSEWNASNLEELHNSGVRYILNVTREIDNFFPGMFEYHNIRVYDEETTNLLEYWNDTFKFITKAKKAGAKCLVHCKMGVSRSASTVIAYAMKEYDWDLDTAFHYVKERRGVTKPNPSFMRQLEEYQGILLASKQRHNKLWRSHSESDLSDRPEPLCKPASHSPVHSDTQNNNNNTTTPSLQQLLGIAVLQALSAEPREPASLPTVAERPPDAPILLLLPPLPRPRAATVVPVSVALGVPAAVSHPPPTLHVLPPTPQPQQASLGPPPAHRPGGLSLDLPERSSLLEGSLSGSASPLSPLSPVSPLSPGASDDDDDNNNPAGSPGRPADSIDFFSAREKFVGLAQDGRARALSEPAQQRTPPPTSLPLEDRGDLTPKKELEDDESSPLSEGSLSPHHTQPSHHHDNGISVRHIVTEIESISQPGCSIPGAVAAPPGGPRSPPAEARQPPPTPRGSVRLATRQLEQRLRQERSPLHSPTSAEPPPPPLKPSPCPPSSPQEGSLSTEPHTHPPHIASGGPGPPPASPVAVHASRSPSPDVHGPPHTGLRSPGQQQPLGDTDPQRGVTLEGVTVRESDTDGGPGAACVAPGPQRGLACSSQELKRVQQTLRELQAFLREAGGAVETPSGDSGQDEAPREAPREAMDTECPAPGTKDRQGKSFRQPAGWRRTVELEARIRQAGLTPPSLMKRSASLAKLDCLELSANELSDWDLSPPPPREPPSGHDDAWKKQRVLVQIPRIEHTSWSRQGGRRPREPSSSPPSPLPGESQQARAHHSSRRGRKVSSEKKQRAALYNTM